MIKPVAAHLQPSTRLQSPTAPFDLLLTAPPQSRSTSKCEIYRSPSTCGMEIGRHPGAVGIPRKLQLYSVVVSAAHSFYKPDWTKKVFHNLNLLHTVVLRLQGEVTLAACDRLVFSFLIEFKSVDQSYPRQSPDISPQVCRKSSCPGVRRLTGSPTGRHRLSGPVSARARDWMEKSRHAIDLLLVTYAALTSTLPLIDRGDTSLTLIVLYNHFLHAAAGAAPALSLAWVVMLDRIYVFLEYLTFDLFK
ncbi:hypothetical protein RRG08_062329 [Elysia crispata]|uniref:Uncharacterized protein n=1 Tax=Elysia crispata TaxID=231223 RepID=A0AAE1CYB7_9GAST|nr:hypothetical protein RRG08_062329 [Elysia crispata]